MCGEESFGTGSNHVREKDGLWAVLLWLDILAARREPVAADRARPLGALRAQLLLAPRLRGDRRARPAPISWRRCASACPGCAASASATSWSSTPTTSATSDPVDGSVSERQGIRILFEGGARIVYRLSGTGTEGATLRVYLEPYEPDPARHDRDTQAALRPLIRIADQLAQIRERTGRAAPSVIT